MKQHFLCLPLVVCFAFTLPTLGRAADALKDPLQGAWQAQSMEADGKPAPPEAVKRMRFTFQGDKLLIKGNFDADREDECSFKVDAKKSPKQLDFSPPDETKPILAIYDVNKDDLKICLRHAGSEQGRPSEFTTKADTQLVLITFKREKP